VRRSVFAPTRRGRAEAPSRRPGAARSHASRRATHCRPGRDHVKLALRLACDSPSGGRGDGAYPLPPPALSPGPRVADHLGDLPARRGHSSSCSYVRPPSRNHRARRLRSRSGTVLAQLACLVVVGCLVFTALESIADKDLKDWLVSFGVAAVGGAIVGVPWRIATERSDCCGCRKRRTVLAVHDR